MNHSSLYHFSFFFLFFLKIILDNFTSMISMVWQSIWKDQPKITLQSPQHKVAGIQEVKRHTCEANRPFHVHVLDHCFMTYMANEVSRKKSRFCSGNPLSISGDTRHNSHNSLLQGPMVRYANEDMLSSSLLRLWRPWCFLAAGTPKKKILQ